MSSSLLNSYSVQDETKKILWEGILRNPLHKSLPDGIEEAARIVSFSGSRLPFIPTNWRFAESVSALKAFRGAMLNVLLKKKYDISYQTIHIDTNHAQLFLMSPVHPLCLIDPEGEKLTPMPGGARAGYEKYFPNCDINRLMEPTTPFIDTATTNIYKLGDGKYYHVHALGIDRTQHLTISSFKEACDIIEASMLQHSANELDELMNETYGQAGTICHSITEYRETPHGKANAHVGLYEIHHHTSSTQHPSWWPSIQNHTSPTRPLFGLKVLDLTRIIAAPTITRELAELGASVLRITSPHITDMSQLQLDLGWGKWNAHLDLRKEEDRMKLKELVTEADVVVDGYRPGVLQKWGFGKEDILEMVNERERGIIYAHENCYGWNGPWAHRSGWQQISDATTGVSLEFGRAMGIDEPVTPVFPNSDFCRPAPHSPPFSKFLTTPSTLTRFFHLQIALNYYTQWLVNSCRTYPYEVWDNLWSRYDRFVFHSTDNMGVTIPAYLKMLYEKKAPVFYEKYFGIRKNGALDVNIKTVKPILNFVEGVVEPGYNVGSRPNGTDVPKWPVDLLTEVIV
ncbi:Succinate--hydroxymethylglutarate CoA-transferase [Leucoagaricus sp. SymC.cos]|nr:Succinate--hydroxymethylglutarate CoA-transferase [Leucoagaricus sp. SymC.cos]